MKPQQYKGGKSLNIEVKSSGPLRGETAVPGDKSISHRAAILGAIGEGTTRIKGFLEGEDCLHTLSCLAALGVNIQREQPGHYLIDGQGLRGLTEPQRVLDVGNSGTTIRLLSGLLAGQPFMSILTGDTSICQRPMDRVIEPLTQMGAQIIGRNQNRFAPICIQGGTLKGIGYQSPVASAQVKSAILLAGLNATGITTVKEPLTSRDHTERMLRAFGAHITVRDREVSLIPGATLLGQDITIPGDISSAAFFLVAASIIPGSELLVKNVCLNPTRTGVLKALHAMGATLQILDEREETGEPVGDVLVRSGSLKGISFEPEWIPSLIDEIPILAVAAACAEGTTTISHAGELRHKETDRLKVMTQELAKFGVQVEELPDGMVITGTDTIRGTHCSSHGDHRIAMALAILALRASGTTTITNAEAVNVSFPGFFETLKSCEV